VRDENISIELAGVVLTDARATARVDLGDLAGVHVVTLIRHRY
jgi:hypothetical protein